MSDEKDRGIEFSLNDKIISTDGKGRKKLTYRIGVAASDEEMSQIGKEILEDFAEETGGELSHRPPIEERSRSHFVGATKWKANWVPSKDRQDNEPSAS